MVIILRQYSGLIWAARASHGLKLTAIKQSLILDSIAPEGDIRSLQSMDMPNE